MVNRHRELTNVCSLYHAYVIPAITNATHPLLYEVADETCYVRFLCRGTTTRDNSR